MPTHLATAEAGLEQASLSPEKVESEPRPRRRKPSGPSNVSLLRGEAGDHGLSPKGTSRTKREQGRARGPKSCFRGSAASLHQP